MFPGVDHKPLAFEEVVRAGQSVSIALRAIAKSLSVARHRPEFPLSAIRTLKRSEKVHARELPRHTALIGCLLGCRADPFTTNNGLSFLGGIHSGCCAAVRTLSQPSFELVCQLTVRSKLGTCKAVSI